MTIPIKNLQHVDPQPQAQSSNITIMPAQIFQVKICEGRMTSPKTGSHNLIQSNSSLKSQRVSQSSNLMCLDLESILNILIRLLIGQNDLIHEDIVVFEI